MPCAESCTVRAQTFHFLQCVCCEIAFPAMGTDVKGYSIDYHHTISLAKTAGNALAHHPSLATAITCNLFLHNAYMVMITNLPVTASFAITSTGAPSSEEPVYDTSTRMC